MRKSHFTPIHDTIPYTFYQREDIMVLGIENNLVERSLFAKNASSAFPCSSSPLLHSGNFSTFVLLRARVTGPWRACACAFGIERFVCVECCDKLVMAFAFAASTASDG